MRLRGALRAAAAAVLAASLIFVAGVSAYYGRPASQAEVELGFDNHYLPEDRAEFVQGVTSGSPAETADLRAGDRIVAFDGSPLASADSMSWTWLRHHPGDRIVLTVRRPGVVASLVLPATFRRRSVVANAITRQLNTWFPWPFILVGLAVLFLRLDDLNAWILALLFGGVAVSHGLVPPAVRPAWWPALMAYQAVFLGVVGPLYYWFHARFPSPIQDRRFPWVKWVAFALGFVAALGGVRDGHLRFPLPAGALVDGNRLAVLFVVACLSLGLACFAVNFFRTEEAEARRKLRILFWGTVVGLGPNLLRLLIESTTAWQPPPWVNDMLSALLVLLPVAFAYAVFVHRVLEIPVLLRRSARYLLVQRGFTFLLALTSIALVLAFALSVPRLHPGMETNQPAGIALGAGLGTALLWSGTEVHKRVSGRIDRAFFRSAYDARQLLESLAEKTRTATGLAELARLLEFHLRAALHPRFLLVHLEPGPAAAPEPPELAVPILGRDGGQLALLLLGPRLSEEPYSGEDRRLLGSAASQTATALENIRLAEEIAARIEGERRAAREMEIAREVQARLLPQAPPRLRTLECAAHCIQARAVGGDYYDFLDLGSDCTGLLLADVSGKGVHAALLVAHLQACLRTQAAMNPRAPVDMLRQVNQMLYRSTAPQHFATLFLGIYDDARGELLYVNCGHNPPLCLRRNGGVARLEATATVIGAFERWDASACLVRLESGDLLAIFSDGIPEAPRGEEDFGEGRLIEELQTHRAAPVDALVSRVLRRVQDFSGEVQADDLTLMVARAR